MAACGTAPASLMASTTQFRAGAAPRAVANECGVSARTTIRQQERHGLVPAAAVAAPAVLALQRPPGSALRQQLSWRWDHPALRRPWRSRLCLPIAVQAATVEAATSSGKVPTCRRSFPPRPPPPLSAPLLADNLAVCKCDPRHRGLLVVGSVNAAPALSSPSCLQAGCHAAIGGPQKVWAGGQRGPVPSHL